MIARAVRNDFTKSFGPSEQIAAYPNMKAAGIGVFLVVVWLIGLRLDASAWMTWLLGVAGAVAAGIALVDREQVSRASRAQSLVYFALALYSANFVGWSRGVPRWL